MGAENMVNARLRLKEIVESESLCDGLLSVPAQMVRIAIREFETRIYELEDALRCALGQDKSRPHDATQAFDRRVGAMEEKVEELKAELAKRPKPLVYPNPKNKHRDNPEFDVLTGKPFAEDVGG